MSVELIQVKYRNAETGIKLKPCPLKLRGMVETSQVYLILTNEGVKDTVCDK